MVHKIFGNSICWLLFLIAGCGGTADVEIPEEPAPMPTVEPTGAGASLPAADDQPEDR